MSEELIRLAAREPRWTEIAEAVPGLLFISDAKGANLYTNGEYQRFTGRTADELNDQGWVECLHPDDRARAAKAWARAVKKRARYDEEYRFLDASGAPRWFRCRAAPSFNNGGDIVRWVGVGFDIQARKEAEARREIVLSELRHRAKNMLTMVQAVADVTSRDLGVDASKFREAFAGRLGALARTNDALIRADWAGLDLHTLIRDEIAPFGDQVAAQCFTAGPIVVLPANKAMSVVLMLHELLTNAVKHGALSVPEGEVRLSWSDLGDCVKVVWEERDGPPVSAQPSRRGFGTRLIKVLTARDLDNSTHYELRPEGARCSFTFRRFQD